MHAWPAEPAMPAERAMRAEVANSTFIAWLAGLWIDSTGYSAMCKAAPALAK